MQEDITKNQHVWKPVSQHMTTDISGPIPKGNPRQKSNFTTFGIHRGHPQVASPCPQSGQNLQLGPESLARDGSRVISGPERNLYKKEH